MKYYSLENKDYKVDFKDAVLKGLAPDKGLFFPEKIPYFDKDFWEKSIFKTKQELAFDVVKPFTEECIDEASLKRIINETLSFDFPLVHIEESIYCLELFHGPTLAFKDVGARFMARCLGYFNSENLKAKNTILVATSGDTGGAVADGFLGIDGVEVVILYPSKKVSLIQELQLTTQGKNIKALEIEGTFDDCQDMVKKAFLDKDLENLGLTSANSINIARWIPQLFYYLFIYQDLAQFRKDIIVSVPSGNFGNIAAGLLAYKMGLPIHHWIAATNANDTVPKFFETGIYEAKKSVQTISNAMDVGNPSNFPRIIELFKNDINSLKNAVSSFSFNDTITKEQLATLYKNHNYIAEPHGAIGYLGLKEKVKDFSNKIGVFLETAHPIKFLDEVEPIINAKINEPYQIKNIYNKEKKSYIITSYKELKEFLVSN